jgi:DNA-binding beta-propeller fold protein YncE
VGTLPRQLAVVRGTGPGPTRAVVTSFTDGTLALVSVIEGAEREIDWDDNVMTTTMGAPMGVSRVEFGAASAPRGVAVTSTGRYAFVALSGTDQLAVLDLDRRVVCETIPLPRPVGEPAGASVPDQVVILPTDTRAYVGLLGTASNAGSSLAIVSVRNATDCTVMGNEVTGYVTDLGGGPRPVAMALNPAATRLAVAGFGNNRVIVVDVGTGTPLDLYPSDPARRFFEAASVPTALVWTGAGDRLYWGKISGRPGGPLEGSGSLQVGTLADGSVSYDVGINGPVYSMVLSGDGATLYVGEARGGIAAVSTALFSGSRGEPGTGSGGCLDARGRAVACPVSYAVPGGGSGVRSLVRLGP